MRTHPHASHVGATKLNEISSRSHAIFMLIVEKSTLGSVDGGGRSTGGTGDAMEAFRGLAPGMGKATSSGDLGGLTVQQSVRVGKLNLVSGGQVEWSNMEHCLT